MLSTIMLSQAIHAQSINMANRYQINKDGSYIIFKTTLAGMPVIRGSLKAYQATIFYDPEDVMSSSATIRFGSEGFSTAHDKRDAQLQGPDFLNTAQFPGIWFQGTEVNPTKKGFDLIGTMNIKDIQKPLTIHIETPKIMRGAMNKMDLMIVKGHLSLNRKDFHLGTTGDWATYPMFGEVVDIEFSFLCTSYTLEYLTARFVGQEQAVGKIYQEVKANGVESGLELTKRMMKDKQYKSDNWLNNLANIGWILMVDDMGEASLPFYEMALKKNSKHMSSLLRLGDAYVIAGQHDKALAHYRQEWTLPERARFTHIPHMIKLLSKEFTLAGMK